MTGFGGLISFDVGSIDRAREVLGRFRLMALAESLGGVETLISHPAIMTHASVPADRRAALGITDGLIRISVGIEDVPGSHRRPGAGAGLGLARAGGASRSDAVVDPGGVGAAPLRVAHEQLGHVVGMRVAQARFEGGDPVARRLDQQLALGGLLDDALPPVIRTPGVRSTCTQAASRASTSARANGSTGVSTGQVVSTRQTADAFSTCTLEIVLVLCSRSRYKALVLRPPTRYSDTDS